MTERYKTIPLKPSTYELLDKLRGNKEWDTFIREIVNKKQQEEDEIIIIPDTLNLEDVLTALEEVKPPSKYREMIFFFMIATLGGIGLGVVIP
ncbi:MAG: hypothetical protein QXX12_03035 [Nanopusillaceae archaeon]